MGITRRKFTLEFKTEAAHRVIDTGRSVIDVGAPLTGSVGHGVQPSVSTTTTEGRGRSANARAMPAAMLVPPPPTSSTWEARLTQRTDVASTSHHRGLEASWSCNSRAQIFRSGLFCGRLWDRLQQPELPERPDQQELKIDRSFVTGISASAKDQAIVAATVSLACSLGVRLVAEGVETAMILPMAPEDSDRPLWCRWPRPPPSSPRWPRWRHRRRCGRSLRCWPTSRPCPPPPPLRQPDDGARPGWRPRGILAPSRGRRWSGPITDV